MWKLIPIFLLFTWSCSSQAETKDNHARAKLDDAWATVKLYYPASCTSLIKEIRLESPLNDSAVASVSWDSIDVIRVDPEFAETASALEIEATLAHELAHVADMKTGKYKPKDPVLEERANYAEGMYVGYKKCEEDRSK